VYKEQGVESASALAARSFCRYELALERLRPAPLQRQLVAAKRLGRKSGSGFYDYADAAPAHDDAVEPSQALAQETSAVIGFSEAARNFAETFAQRYERVQTIENDDLLDAISERTTIAIDCGDDVADRTEAIVQLDAMLAPQCVIFANAYACDVARIAAKVRHPERVVPYGLLASVAQQRAIEVVDTEAAADDALELAQELEALATRDVLTGLPNRLILAERLTTALRRAARAVHDVAVIFVDCDDFKRINDTLGHPSGDRYLQGIAAALQSAVREVDTVARLGGDEFIVLLERCGDKTTVQQIVDRIRKRTAVEIDVGTKHVLPHLSIGVSCYPGDGTDGETLIRQADEAMYSVKRSGGNGVRFFGEAAALRLEHA